MDEWIREIDYEIRYYNQQENEHYSNEEVYDCMPESILSHVETTGGINT